jgi:hypothetical protein
MTAVPASAITIDDRAADPTDPIDPADPTNAMKATKATNATRTTRTTNPTEALARRLRAHLQALAALRVPVPVPYRNLAEAMLLSPPHTIHQVTEALEQLMAEDAATDRPFIAAMAVSKWRSGLPAPGFFDCAARLGRFAGDATGPEAKAFHAGEFNALVALWADPRD